MAGSGDSHTVGRATSETEMSHHSVLTQSSNSCSAKVPTNRLLLRHKTIRATYNHCSISHHTLNSTCPSRIDLSIVKERIRPRWEGKAAISLLTKHYTLIRQIPYNGRAPGKVSRTTGNNGGGQWEEVEEGQTEGEWEQQHKWELGGGWRAGREREG